MAIVYVNDQPVDIGNERLNLIEAAEKAGVFIPHYCWHPALSVVASCRMCLVETGERKPDGTILMQPKVVPGCQTPARDGTIIITGEYGKAPATGAAAEPLPYPANYRPGDKAKKSQADTLENLLLNHPLDCPVCDKAGECKLQDFSFKYGRSQSRLVDEKNTPPNKPNLSERIALFTDRCIMCSRCVRFTREVAGTSELQIVNRGNHAEIDVFPGRPLNNKLSGNVVDLCPVGALGSKDFLYKQRVWFLKTTPSICAGCSTGCAIDVDANKDIVFRLRARFNPQAQGHFICDEGRWGYHYVNSAERHTRAFGRKDGELKPVSYADALSGIRVDLANAVAEKPESVVFALSPFLTVEEAYLLASYAKSLSPNVKLVLGPVPVVGQDDTFPKNWKGEPVQPVKFTIRAEKAPNRLGVEAVLKHFQGDVIPLNNLNESVARGQVKTLFLSGGYPAVGWLNDFETNILKTIPTLIVQDLFRTELSKSAKWVLPAASFAEKDGTFVNHAGLAQALRRVVKSPGEVRTEGQVAADLSGRKGLLHVPTIRKEIAAAIPALSVLGGELGEHGVKLSAPAMATV
ncbi:molybdopterin-dependent oxidoreductase [Tuwongella immobilis]|uniref:2Fe-2S ferredoxin-type domain-containing protein n=1 Tax=Tuwongella immobilis TaxID=692036 RepID=A0A6C2YHK3_9BACT|nr:molybdopterin-dependent oxidoreductase [Tuwongella immobilis]VIP00897.1 nadh dehydrogenase : Ferredoxin OS=Planctomyces limnophilus (strain ATCC 43296 / DSM 3776 / IFAM 1008 / 290) GN=Plim_3863 PE=4 SV=1: Fer2_4: NADH-G_4Fe-4S_3: Molybdop_Fe4S4: Molybdopterin [Tuwongella immobilis]VTR97212.1 nadh dehydrogenase : Ferredoxin OS=Planctomyces limnophilus (strain ATCC 43296 / DSM 3776 / IFAM 1008 / 290) GN=Plim_3863 PE=4 SV=1: Fer2_4: NADH-G_4Fe-4S_3: Molybdop_Fe4S4: Molybdopterin [Tuwongella immob